MKDYTFNYNPAIIYQALKGKGELFRITERGHQFDMRLTMASFQQMLTNHLPTIPKLVEYYFAIQSTS